MTNNEAKNVLENFLDFGILVNDESVNILENAIDVAVKALEKQIEEKPRVLKNVMICCKCSKIYATPKGNYCMNCGQKFDWE